MTRMEIRMKIEAMESILGADFQKYMDLLNRRFRISSSRITKEKFDEKIVDLIPMTAIQPHFDFMCAFGKEIDKTKSLERAFLRECQYIRTNINKGELQRAVQQQSSFSMASNAKSLTKLPPGRIIRYPVNLGNSVPVVIFPEERDESPIFPDFPDPEAIHGRALTIVLEQKLDKVGEQSVTLIMNATRHLLKNIISAVLSRRGCSEHKYPMKLSVSDMFPQKRSRLGSASHSQIASSVTKYHKNASTRSRPVSAYELFKTLQIHRHVIPNCDIYYLNMERISFCMHYPNGEETGLKLQCITPGRNTEETERNR